ncbi:alpha/beta hydrolase family protein [bacterium BMS3Abin07]|nr:alpha/beta hydrolase family protein [bacterium BMS3Abin07]GBE33452.1 alpha/beta hydrolase family protein [bacterium BMS3Bbin05]HDZ88682.1 alpha/beta fold hydrolase [Nitrospirota bacterium]
MKDIIYRKRPIIIILTGVLLVLSCITFVSRARAGKIVLTTSDGYRIAGVVTRPEKKSNGAGVVLLHMYNYDRNIWKPLIPYLSARGITVLAIDMRGHGESRTGPDGRDNLERVLKRDPSLFKKMHLDAEAAVRYLQNKEGISPDHTGLIGASIGCSVAIQTAVARNVKVDAVVVMTPGKKYLGVPTMKHIEKWPGIPLLILSSREEAGKGALSIYKKLKHGGAELVLFDEEGIHGTFMFGKVDGVEKLISDWIADKLK